MNYLRSTIASIMAPVLAVSVEAESTQGIERELVYYGKVVDFNEVREKAAHWEEQEQWELKSPIGTGRIRVRYSHGKGQDEATFTNFVMTTKIRKEDGTDIETEQDVSEDIFLAFKRLAPNGMRKTRYYYPFESNGVKLIWEVDVFNDPENDGTPHEWVKVDLELPTDYQTTGEKWTYPVEFSEIIQGGGRLQSDAEKERVQKLYDDVILLKNVGKSRGLSKEVSNEGLLDFIFKPKPKKQEAVAAKKERDAIEAALAAFTEELDSEWLKKVELAPTPTVSNRGFSDLVNSKQTLKQILDKTNAILKYGEDCLAVEIDFEKQIHISKAKILAKRDDIDAAEVVLRAELKRLNAIAPPTKLYNKYHDVTDYSGKPFLMKDKGVMLYDYIGTDSWAIKEEAKEQAKQDHSNVPTLTKDDITNLIAAGKRCLDYLQKCKKAHDAEEYGIVHVYYEGMDEFDDLIWEIGDKHDFKWDIGTDVFEGGLQHICVVDGPYCVIECFKWLAVKLHRYIKASCSSQGVGTEGLFDFLNQEKPVNPLDEKDLIVAFDSKYCNQTWLNGQSTTNAPKINNAGFQELANSNVDAAALIKHLKELLEFGNDSLKAEIEFESTVEKVIETLLAKKDDIDAADKAFGAAIIMLEKKETAPTRLYPKYSRFRTITGSPYLDKDEGTVYYEPFVPMSGQERSTYSHSYKVPAAGDVTPLSIKEIETLALAAKELIKYGNRAYSSYLNKEHGVDHLPSKDKSEFKTLVEKIQSRHVFGRSTLVFEGAKKYRRYCGGPNHVSRYIRWILIKLDHYFKASLQ